MTVLKGMFSNKSWGKMLVYLLCKFICQACEIIKMSEKHRVVPVGRDLSDHHSFFLY